MLLYSFVKSFLFKHKSLLFSTILLLLVSCSAEEESAESSEAAVQETGTSEETFLEMVEAESTEIISTESTEEFKEEEESVNSSSGAPVVPIQSTSSVTPSRLKIPAIEVDASVDGYGLDAEGKMEVPDEGESIAWFERGAKPGSQGNAVLAGHVDDRSGPAVFYDLKNLEQGDEIIVSDDKGDSLTFVVTHKEAYPYNDAPIDLVFGASSSRNLNLITCTGEFDSSAGTHRERLVVFTKLKD